MLRYPFKSNGLKFSIVFLLEHSSFNLQCNIMLLPNSITQSFPLNHITKLSFNNQRPTIMHNVLRDIRERRSMLSNKNI